MTAYQSELATLALPEFGLPTVEPAIPARVYRERMAAFRRRMHAEGYDVAIVYGDRVHFANLTYLTGYDPRFEEALLIVDLKRFGANKPLLLVGNEGMGYVNVSPIKSDFEIALYQNFSLLGQPRGKSRSLTDILRAGGVEAGSKVGAAGWKYYSEAETWLEIPGFLVDALRELTGSAANVRNAGYLLMDASHGLRATNEIEQLAAFEFASTFASQSVRNVVFGLRPGMTELEAVELMRLNGLPESTYTFLASGSRAVLGMVSPSLNRIAIGDRFTVCCALWGALTCRAGFAVENAQQLPSEIQDYVDKLAAPYFQAIVAWYEQIGIGVTGGELYQLIHDRIGDAFYGVGLNPGHLIHLDEWLNSPIYEGSSEQLQSGMALQVDVIPATGTPYFTINIEDGIALADDALRAAFAQQYPEAWGRIQARRDFMQNALGITLKPEVLPFSNIPAYLPPFILSPQRAMRAL